MMLGLAFPSCSHYTLKWNWNNLSCLMVTQLIQISCVTWEFYGGISCDCLKRKEVRQLPFKPPWLYSGKGMLALSWLLESHSCKLSWPGIWVVPAPIISNRKGTAVPEGFPTEPGHGDSIITGGSTEKR